MLLSGIHSNLNDAARIAKAAETFRRKNTASLLNRLSSEWLDCFLRCPVLIGGAVSVAAHDAVVGA